MKFRNHFYFGRWPEVPYTSKTKRSPLGHDVHHDESHYYAEYKFDHTHPVGTELSGQYQLTAADAALLRRTPAPLRVLVPVAIGK